MQTPTKNPYRECLRCPFKFFITEEIFHSIIRSFERSTYRGSNKSDLLLTTQCNSCSTSNRQDDARRAGTAYTICHPQIGAPIAVMLSNLRSYVIPYPWPCVNVRRLHALRCFDHICKCPISLSTFMDG